MKKKRNRVIVNDTCRNLPKLSDCSVETCNFYSLFIYATGQSVLVSALTPDSAVYTLGLWLHSVGLDSRVLVKESFESKDVLSSSLLCHNAMKIRKDETLF